ncbi:hypothetical protein [Mucilaginibacter sp. dw_454]|uniref:hypothetical protein n=1 Tax=Mucilaginibacter sp. dw_454 TaxID=2720079 RepID=UPI001BD49B1F|nr:hypothetical protein [Mucilaginibacter sp. dw_454]
MKSFFTFLAFISCALGCTQAKKECSTIFLGERWRFKIGDSKSYSSPGLDDSGWSLIKNDETFEQLGVSNDAGDGIAWYRYKVVIPSAMRKHGGAKKLEFYLGLIGDRDQFFLNGNLIGGNNVAGDTSFVSAASMPDLTRKYEIPIGSRLINWDGENLIAVRVLSKQKAGGGMTSDVFIKTSTFELVRGFKLAARWKFKAGDSSGYKNIDLNDKEWRSISSGEVWERQGHNGLDGFAWYRQAVDLTGLSLQIRQSNNSTVRFLIGKVDDTDQVFLNGELIGENGSTAKPGYAGNIRFKDRSTLAGLDRMYDLSSNDRRIKWSGKNVLAVRVFDSGGDGGLTGRPQVAVLGYDNNTRVDLSRLYKINGNNVLDTVAVLYNNNAAKFRGRVKYDVQSTGFARKIERDFDVEIGPRDSLAIPISIPYTREKTTLKFFLDDESSSTIFYNEVRLPFVLFK